MKMMDHLNFGSFLLQINRYGAYICLSPHLATKLTERNEANVLLGRTM